MRGVWDKARWEEGECGPEAADDLRWGTTVLYWSDAVLLRLYCRTKNAPVSDVYEHSTVPSYSVAD